MVALQEENKRPNPEEYIRVRLVSICTLSASENYSTFGGIEVVWNKRTDSSSQTVQVSLSESQLPSLSSIHDSESQIAIISIRVLLAMKCWLSQK